MGTTIAEPTGLDSVGKKGVAIAPNVGHTIVVSTIGLDLMMTGRRNTILRYLGRVWDGQLRVILCMYRYVGKNVSKNWDWGLQMFCGLW